MQAYCHLFTTNFANVVRDHVHCFAYKLQVHLGTMSVDVECFPMSASKQSEVMRLDITDVTSPLPGHIKLRWGPYKQRHLERPEAKLEQIQARMAAADRKRQVRTQECRNNRDRKGVLACRPACTSADGSDCARRRDCMLTVSDNQRVLVQEALRCVMTRAQTHSVATGSSGHYTTAERAHRLEVSTSHGYKQALIPYSLQRLLWRVKLYCLLLPLIALAGQTGSCRSQEAGLYRQQTLTSDVYAGTHHHGIFP